MKLQSISGLLALGVVALVFAAPARADQLQFSLNSSGCSGGCTVPAGTVTLTQDGSLVDVSVSLTNGDFIDSGPSGGTSHTSFVFDIAGAPQISITNLAAGFTYPADTTVDSPFGTFDYGIDCIATGTPGLPPGTPTCGPGASHSVPPPLTFTVGLANGNALSINSFTGHLYSPDGPDAHVFFAADIYDSSTGNTGAVGAVPEPSSVALIGCSLAGVVAFRRKLKL